jgi:hypothetical protein
MNLQDVIAACGPLPQVSQNMPGDNTKGRGFTIVAVLIIGGISYLFYREWKRRKDLENKKDELEFN